MALPITDSAEGRKALSVELYHRFQAMKTYGKDSESLESIIEVFTRDLAAESAEDILQAISLHAKRNAEFPTTADIAGLIKRRGRPPLTESMYIQLSKKPGEDRTASDWQYIRDFESEMNDGFKDRTASPGPSIDDRDENTRLRLRIKALESEMATLRLLAGEKLEERRLMDFKPSYDKKIENTVAWMRAQNLPQSEIDEFLVSVAA